MSGYHSPWAVLGIKQTDDDRAIRKAYSAKLKQIDVEANPAAFIALREALEQARQSAAWKSARDEERDRLTDSAQPTSAEILAPAFAKPDTASDTALTEDGSIWLAHRIGPVFDSVRLELTQTGNVKARPLPPVAEIPQYSDLETAAQSRRARSGSGGMALGLPAQPCEILFPPPTPLLINLLRRPKLETSDNKPGNGKARGPSPLPDHGPLSPIGGTDAESSEPWDRDMLYPSTALAGDDTAVATVPEEKCDNSDVGGMPDMDDPRRWVNMQGAVSIVRDDWGDADRLKLEALYHQPDFGWDQILEAEEIARRIFASDHLDRIDYREWMENWTATLIARTLPKSDGLLKIASRVFSWGTDAGQLYHSAAIDACIARNRDLASAEKLRQPSHHWYKIFAQLQRSAPDKISTIDGRQWKDVQKFIDTTRIERPTLEWELNPDHVRLWDQYIDRKNGGTEQAASAFKWYHGLIIAFMVLQLIVRCAGPAADEQASPKSGYLLVDREIEAKDKGKFEEWNIRQTRGPLFNLALRDDDDAALRSVHQLDMAVDISRYVMLDDIMAYLDNHCDENCNFRIVQVLDELARTTVTIEDPKPPIMSGPMSSNQASGILDGIEKLPPAERERIIQDIVSGEYKRLDEVPVTPVMRNVAPPPAAAPVPPPQRVNIPLQWNYAPDNPNIDAEIVYSAELKRLGFKAKDVAELSNRLERNITSSGKVEWRCAERCDGYINQVLQREGR